jgi:hypothetical protein
MYHTPHCSSVFIAWLSFIIFEESLHLHGPRVPAHGAAFLKNNNSIGFLKAKIWYLLAKFVLNSKSL